MSNWWMNWAERIAAVLAELWTRLKSEADSTIRQGDGPRPASQASLDPPNNPHLPTTTDTDSPR